MMSCLFIVLIVFAHRADANVCSSCSACLLIVLLQLTYRAAYRVALQAVLKHASGLQHADQLAETARLNKVTAWLASLAHCFV